MRQFFDDGSWIEVDPAGTSYAANTAGVVVSKVDAAGTFYAAPTYWTDAREAAKLDAYSPAPAGDSRPWFERVAEYGLSRAIDNHFGPTASNKTTQPATFAGQNGQTYTVGGQPGQGIGGGGILPLLILGGIAFLAMG